LEVIQWRIKIKSVRIPVAVVQLKAEIHFAVINAVNNLRVQAHPAIAAIRAVVIIKKIDGRAWARPKILSRDR
jgi:hypothetical protein